MNALDTRATLLLRLRDLEDRQAWAEFVDLYTPLLYAYAIKHGFQDADAADVAQESMCNVVRSIRRFEYDAEKGSFRGWLLTVIRNQIRKKANSRQKQVQATGNSDMLELLSQQPGRDEIDSQWERDYQLHLFHWVAKRVRNEFREATWQAFWSTTVENNPIDQVALDLKMSVGAIYIARSRVLARIRAELLRVEQQESHRVP